MVVEFGSGVAIGAVMGLTGAGGGILAVPMLVFVVHLNVLKAAPIGLLAVGMAAALGAIIGLTEGIVRYRAAMLMAFAGMLLSPVGVWIAGRIDNRWLTFLFALILLFVAFHAYRQADSSCQANAGNGIAHPCVRDAASGRFIWTAPCARALATSGTVAGFLSGLLGVGGGFVMVPALRRYTDLAMPSTIATSLAVIALISLSSVASSAFAGNIDWRIAIPFSMGAVTGMLAGKILSRRMAGPQLQRGFAVISALVSLGLIFKVFSD